VEGADEEGQNNHILASIFIKNLHHIDSAHGSVDFEMGVQLWWLNPSCKGYAGDKAAWEDKIKPWSPLPIDFVGDIDVGIKGDESWYIRESYARYGVINFYQEFKGRTAVHMHLQDFPFDRQRVTIRFGSPLYSDAVCHLTDRTARELLDESQARMHLEEWDLVSPINIREVAEWDIDSRRDVSWLEIYFDVKRKAGYYVTHVIAMIALLIAMGWSIFLVPPEKLDARAAIAVTLFLALLALNFVINGLIPKISYSTFLSQYFVMGYATTALGVFESMASYCMWKFSEPCRMPDTVANATLTPAQTPPFPEPWPDCWDAYYLDWATLCIGAVCEILYTIAFLYRGLRARPGERIIHPRHVPNPHAQGGKKKDKHEKVGEHSDAESAKKEELKTVKVD